MTRVDKWLWAARFFKTRGAATEAVVGGRVHVNGERVKPAKDVRVGDRLEITIAALQRSVIVTGIAEKRGSATVAATLYEETADSLARREQHEAECAAHHERRVHDAGREAALLRGDVTHRSEQHRVERHAGTEAAEDHARKDVGHERPVDRSTGEQQQANGGEEQPDRERA